MTEKNRKKLLKEKEKKEEVKKIWEPILPNLINEIQNAENNSYSINLLEEVKMANKFVRETKKNEKKEVSLRVNVDENANSRILAKLFQYKSPDGKYEILQSLLDYISNRDENAVRNFGKIEIDNTIITTEETLNQNNGRIDILVRTRKYAIIFENKLFNAPDQEHQLARYIEIANDAKFKNENIFVIYLSSYGDEPAEDSWKSSSNSECNNFKGSFADKYANLSFKDDILRWLKDYVLPNVRKKDTDLESALVQYINYLDRLFMMNNDDLTKWLEEKLEEEQQWKESSETGRLEIVEGLLTTLNKNKGKKVKINVERLADLISFTKDNTNEDLLNKTIAVIENLRDNCRDKVLEPFYRVSKDYFDEIRPSYPSAAYCVMKKKEWKHEIRFIWNPFFFNPNKNEYKLTLEIILTDNITENNNRINKFESVQEAIKNVPKLTIQGVKICCDKSEQAVARAHKLLEITLKTDKKLLSFAPKDQEDLFKAIYGSLSGVIDAIDKCF